MPELDGGSARAKINDALFKFTTGRIEAPTVLGDTSNTSLGQFPGRTPTKRPLRVTLTQASLDESDDPWSTPYNVAPFNVVRLRIWPDYLIHPDWFWDVPQAVVGPITHTINNTGESLQPVDLTFEANGPWAMPGEELFVIPT
jgi:hypothetical protein